MPGKSELFEPFAAPEIFFDRLTNFEIRNGMIFCSAVREQDGQSIIVLRLVTTLAGMALSVAAREEAINVAAQLGTSVVKLVG